MAGNNRSINLSSWEQWCFSRSKCKGAFWFHRTNWCEGLHETVILHLKKSSAPENHLISMDFSLLSLFWTRLVKGGSETLLDVLFPVTFKCAMLMVIRKDPRHYWCIMSNDVLMCIENHVDLLKWLPNDQAGRFMSPPMDATNTQEPTRSIWPGPARNKKNQGLKFCKDRKHEAGSTNAELKSWTPDTNRANAKFTTLCKDRKYGSEHKSHIKLASKDWNTGHILKAQARALKFYKSWASDAGII